MRAVWMIGAVVLVGISGRAEECALAVAVSSSPVVSQVAVVQAKGVAGRIFSGMGVNLRWGGRVDGCQKRIAARLENSRSPEERPESLAYATIGLDSGTQIHVFVDRVRATVGQAGTGILLGHVLAHEIAHLLEGAPRHSESGLMKAHWERNDLDALLCHPLRFEAVDEVLIHAGLARAREMSKAVD